MLRFPRAVCYDSVMSTITNPNFPDWITGSGTTRPTRDVTRNVIDHYKGWETSAVSADLQKSAYPVWVVCENFAHDFNIATAVRNANVFNVRGVVLVGSRRWDHRGTVGTQHYTPVHHVENPEEFYQSVVSTPGNRLVVADNLDGATPLPEFSWDHEKVTYLVFGQEQIGVSNLALQYATDVVYVPQRGSVRSMNVGTTSGVFLYDYSTKAPK